MVTIVKFTQLDIGKFPSYIERLDRFNWNFKFTSLIFEVMILQMKQKTKFWKIGPWIFKENCTPKLTLSMLFAPFQNYQHVFEILKQIVWETKELH